MPKTVLELRSVSRMYGTGDVQVAALSDVSLSLEAGQFVLIVGGSGSGKSTLLNVMGMLDKPTSGSVLVDGVDTVDMSEVEITVLRSKKIGFIFQFSNLISDLTVIENVMLPRQIAGMDSKMHKEATELLEYVGIASQAHKRANMISGGQAQRVAIARGLINRPAIIFADEPTGNLDSVTAKSVVNLMKSIAKRLECAFVIVTHDRKQFGAVDRIITIMDGKIVNDTPYTAEDTA